VLLAALLLLLGGGLLLLWRQRDGEPGVPTEALALDLGGGVTLELVYIQEGEFGMGAPEGERDSSGEEKPRHPVRITRPFWLGKYAVTQEQYQQVTGGNPSYFCTTGGGKDKVPGMATNRFPVDQVSWDDAAAFCEELNRTHLTRVPEALRRAGYRFGLPTEAQWEYACRAGTKTPFHFGNELNGTQANCDGNHPYGTTVQGPYLQRTCRVGSYAANGFGLYDMHGNVWQWCADYYDPKYYHTSPGNDPFNSKKDADAHRVVRGGSFGINASACRAAYRGWGLPAERNCNSGFRVAIRLD
jgi:formylglycine-generating enzyme required for sulfatase activity